MKATANVPCKAASEVDSSMDSASCSGLLEKISFKVGHALPFSGSHCCFVTSLLSSLGCAKSNRGPCTRVTLLHRPNLCLVNRQP
jgi:hypothetical protein